MNIFELMDMKMKLVTAALKPDNKRSFLNYTEKGQLATL